MEQIASIYAQALFSAAADKNKVDAVRDQLAQFTQAVNESKDLQLFLFSPYFSGDEKAAGLRRIIEDAEPEFINFLELLAQKHRLPAMHRIQARYEDLWAEENKLLPVTVTSAVALPSETIEKIGQSVEAQTGRKVVLSSQVNDKIIGGLVLRVGNMVLDASISNRLERLRKHVTAAAV
ncbi:MAG: F0F1 ATP synthase subunit delta [Thermoleophilaceae bacterium]|nr:F0F1 ATP synthase subunit delta [Thermoleophilaceae bacterium]